ncbi:MAG: hypothetical protein K1X66_01555 [Verrucomicrobiae bacterium]|nr:hypothetical protein [Verrucomicrobiae bacterium]
MNACELFQWMPGSKASEILDYLHQNNKLLYRELLHLLSKAHGTRLPVIQQMPRTERNPKIMTVLQLPTSLPLSFRCLSEWLLGEKNGLLTDFLNELHIEHQAGCVENFPAEPEKAILEKAMNNLFAGHPKIDVLIYLHAFNSMPETQWKRLDELLAGQTVSESAA